MVDTTHHPLWTAGTMGVSKSGPQNPMADQTDHHFTPFLEDHEKT